MTTNRYLASAGYIICIYLGVVPIAETLLGLWPFALGEVAWRYGAVGLLTQALMTPLLGLCLSVALAMHLGHRRMLRALAGLAGVGVLITVIVIPLFLLDMLQMRGSVNEGRALAFDIASLFAVLKMGATVLIGLGIAVGGWKAGGQSTAGTGDAPEPPKKAGMVFRAGGGAKSADPE